MATLKLTAVYKIPDGSTDLGIKIQVPTATPTPTIDWGDGSAIDERPSSGLFEHTYANAGSYTVKVYDALPWIHYYATTTYNNRCISLTYAEGVSSLTNQDYVPMDSLSHLESISFPSTLQSIICGAVNYCNSLKNIYWDATSCYYAESGNEYIKMKYGIFGFRLGRTNGGINVTFGPNCKRIPDYMFAQNYYGSANDSTRIASIDFSEAEQLTLFGERSFYNAIIQCPITIPKIITRFGSSEYPAFSYCSAPSITFETGTTSISENVLKNWMGGYYSTIKTSKVYIPSSVTTVEHDAFAVWTDDPIDIYYDGTTEQWNTLLSHVGNNNYGLTRSSTRVHIVKTVNFNANGGTLPSTFENPWVDSDYPSTLPVPTFAPWTFDGWYTDNGTFAKSIVAGDVIDESRTVYAKFYSNITYNLPTGALNSPLNLSTYTNNDVTNNKLLYAPSMTDYDFDGWYLDAEYGTKAFNMSQFDGNTITLYAKFNAQKAYRPRAYSGEGHTVDLPVDAHTVNGHDAFVNYSLQSISTMNELYALIVQINAAHQHVYFDASAYIPSAYVCLVAVTESSGNKYCEIVDLMHNRVYYNSEGFNLSDEISDYIDSCTVKDNYSNIKLTDISTMQQLREKLNAINSKGDHCFFDLSSYIPGAYVCTVQMYTESNVNYCFVFDILAGKLYGRYTGYNDSETITSYVSQSSGTVSDIIHAISITDNTTTLQDIVQLINRVNIIGHHILLDVARLSTADYLISFTYTTSNNFYIFNSIGLVNGTRCKLTVAATALATTTLASFLSNAIVIGSSVKCATPSSEFELKFYKCTQEEYDAIALKDSDTLYIILPEVT